MKKIYTTRTIRLYVLSYIYTKHISLLTKVQGRTMGAITKCDISIHVSNKVIILELVYSSGTLWVNTKSFTRF